jgi:hypothetical protein
MPQRPLRQQQLRVLGHQRKDVWWDLHRHQIQQQLLRGLQQGLPGQRSPLRLRHLQM